MANDLSIRMLTPDDANLFLDHNERNGLTSGIGTTPIFSAFSRTKTTDAATQITKIKERWQHPVGSEGWERGWGAFAKTQTGELQMVASIELSATRLIQTQMHRAILGIGIESNFRHQGLGKSLMQTALVWAKQQRAIEWIDLGVFAGNAPARRLYEHFKFIEIGRTADCFRVDGHSLDDIQMTLNLNQYSALGEQV